MDSVGHGTVLGWITSICLDSSANPAFAVALFLCVARQPGFGTPAWRADLVRSRLTAADVELRDAAVQAAASSGTRAFGRSWRPTLNQSRGLTSTFVG